MSIRKKVGFYIYDECTQQVLTDRSQKPVLFTDYGKYIEYVKKNRINVLNYRARLVCSRFTKRYSVI